MSLEAHCPTCHFSGRDAALIFVRDPAPRCPNDQTFLRPGPFRKPSGGRPRKRRWQVAREDPVDISPPPRPRRPDRPPPYYCVCGLTFDDGERHANRDCMLFGQVLHVRPGPRPPAPKPPRPPAPKPAPGYMDRHGRFQPHPETIETRPHMNAAQRARSVLRWFRHVTVSEDMLRDLAFPIDPDIFEKMSSRLSYGRQHRPAASHGK